MEKWTALLERTDDTSPRLTDYKPPLQSDVTIRK